MNILFVSSQYPNQVEPNRGIFSRQIVKAMKNRANITVIAPVPTLGPLKFLNSRKKYPVRDNIPLKESLDGVTVYHPPYLALPGVGFLHHLAVRKGLEKLIYSLNREMPIDAVNCHWLFPDGVAVQQVTRRLGVPVMLTALGTDLNVYASSRLRSGQIGRALKNASLVSVLNRVMFDRCVELGVSRDRLRVIPNGVDLEKFSIMDRERCRRKLGLPTGAKLVLFVGALTPIKGPDILLDAFALLIRSLNIRATLCLIGAGHLNDLLREKARTLGIQDAARFVGPVGHQELPLWMNAVDCLCLPSRNEGHPNAMMEALACGTPVVAARVGSIPEFITRTNGLIAHPEHYRDLGAKLGTCLEREYDRTVIRNSVADYDWDGCASRYLAELASLKDRKAEGVPRA